METAVHSAEVHVSADSEHSAEDKRERLDYVDTLRGLASVQVLLSHSLLAFFLGTAMAAPLSGTLTGYVAASPIYFMIDGASAVCIFFVLSGYVLTPLFSGSRSTGGTLLFSRFLRLALPAIASCALSATLFHFFGGKNITASTIARSDWLADGWRPENGLWFLRDAVVNGILLGFQGSSVMEWFGFPTASLASMSDSYVTPLWTLSVEFYGSILVLWLARAKSWTLLVLAIIIFSRSYMLCFLAGHVAAKFRLGGGRPLAPGLVTSGAIAIGIAICLVSHFWSPQTIVKFCSLSTQFLPPCPLANPSYLMRVYGATILTIGIMQNESLRSFLGHARLRSLGRLSFPIYLTHWPIIFGLGSATVLALAPLTGGLPARFAAVLASIVLSVFAARCFEPIDQFALRASRDARQLEAQTLRERELKPLQNLS
jgi:peptidoglycan/LPS O-acetylase OafA/YrhL